MAGLLSRNGDVSAAERRVAAAAKSSAVARTRVTEIAAREAALREELRAAEGRLTAAGEAMADGTAPVGGGLEAAGAQVGALRLALETVVEEVRPRVDARLQEADAAEQSARNALAYLLADRHAARIAARVGAEYPAAIAVLVELRDAAQLAQQAVDAANAVRGDAPPLLGPEERVRDVPSEPRRELSRRSEERWTYASTGVPLPEDLWRGTYREATIQSNGSGVGHIVRADQRASIAPPVEVQKRRFTAVTFIPAHPGAMGDRLDRMLLPPLRATTGDREPQTELLPQGDA